MYKIFSLYILHVYTQYIYTYYKYKYITNIHILFIVHIHYKYMWFSNIYSIYGESLSVVSNSLRTHGLYSPWNSPGQNTGVGSLPLLQRIFPTQGSNSGVWHCRQMDRAWQATVHRVTNSWTQLCAWAHTINIYIIYIRALASAFLDNSILL